jgi:hypothetical protein
MKNIHREGLRFVPLLVFGPSFLTIHSDEVSH